MSQISLHPAQPLHHGVRYVVTLLHHPVEQDRRALAPEDVEQPDLEAASRLSSSRILTDTSTVWARAIASSSDPAFVAPGAIPSLLLQIAGVQDGPTGGDKLSETTYLQRLNTSGGVAPSTGCTQSTDVGKTAFVPYAADYFFFYK